MEIDLANEDQETQQMNTFLCFLLVLSCGIVAGQVTQLIADPGLESLSGNQCSTDNVWHFRSDYLWNRTTEFFDSRCKAFFELPTNAVPGLTKGNQTNINKALIPALPSVTGGNYASSAGVVDMNTPCRAALWAPFTVPTSGATVTLSLKIWVRSNPNLEQVLADGSAVPDADLLQYLQDPEGLLITTDVFPPLREETNMIRIDILAPEPSNNFYDRAFSLIPEHIAGTVDIPNWEDGEVVPANGTNSRWIDVQDDISDIVSTAGTYALRISSAQSRVGVSWGVTDVHVTASGGTKRTSRKRSVDVVFAEAEEKKVVGNVKYSAGTPLFKRK